MVQKKETKDQRTPVDYITLALKGFCMGASDVIPGVSGGTMAFILGIYEELILAIRSFDLKGLRLLAKMKIKDFLNRFSWRFLLAVGVGILTAVFSLSRLLSWLLQNQPVLIWSFFFGLIVASVLTVSKRIKRWRFSRWIWMLGGAVGTYILVGLVPVSTPENFGFLFLSGAIAICAMILPGISGSFMLVLLGKYQFILGAVNSRDLSVLALFSAGACAGIAAFSRLLGWLIKSYHDETVAFLTGLMMGSLRKIWPWKETLETLVTTHGKVIPSVQANVLPAQWNMEVLWSLVLAGIGFCTVLSLDRLANRR